MNKQMTYFGIAILALFFLLFNGVISKHVFGYRIDLTEGKLHTLSEGTIQILETIDEPVDLKLYFSEQASREFPQLRAYADHVKELLTEYKRIAQGKVRLSVIDPQPFSEAEDQAAAFGLQAVPINQGGDSLYFGLVGTNAIGEEEKIPFFQLNKETFLEYDLTQLVYKLTTIEKPLVGIISGLPLEGGFDPITRQRTEPLTIVKQLQQLFDINLIESDSDSLDQDIKTLILIHPKNVSEKMLYAIDQFALRGGRLLIFVDPLAEQEPVTGASRASSLDKLFDAWGIAFDKDKILGDLKNALVVRGGPEGSPVRHLATQSFSESNIAQDDVIMHGLSHLHFGSPGVISLTDKATVQFYPLVSSSQQTQLIPSARLSALPDPRLLLNEFESSGNLYHLAGRVRGPIKTAFPDEAPKHTSSQSAHLNESQSPLEAVIIADTDVLSDRLWVTKMSFFGQELLDPFASNGDFIVNAVDNLSGNSALISIRGRGHYQRPFDRVHALKLEAESEFRQQEQLLQKRLQETEQQLTELQSGRTNSESIVLTPEQNAALQGFIDERVKVRKELRNVQHQLNKNIEALGQRLKMLNIGLVPFLILFFAFYLAYRRNNKRRAHAV